MADRRSVPVAVRRPEFWDLDPVALKLSTMHSIIANAMRKYELPVFGGEQHGNRCRMTVRNDADLYDITITLRTLDQRPGPEEPAPPRRRLTIEEFHQRAHWFLIIAVTLLTLLRNL